MSERRRTCAGCGSWNRKVFHAYSEIAPGVRMLVGLCRYCSDRVEGQLTLSSDRLPYTLVLHVKGGREGAFDRMADVMARSAAEAR